MSVRLAINGMGVIGREIFKTLFGKEGYEIVFINDTHMTARNLAYLLSYDTLYHDWQHSDTVTADEETDTITVDGRTIRLYKEADVNNLPLGELKVDVALDCEGFYNTKYKAGAYLTAGARKAIICQSAGNDLPTIAYNVNHDTLKVDDTIISVPQMESQVAAQVMYALNELGIKRGYCKAFRSYTNSQNTMDSYNKDGNFALGRAAAWNITPLVSGFGKGLGLIVPDVNGIIKSVSYRAPIINGSVMDVTVELDGIYSADYINACLKAAAHEGFGYAEEPLCSTDAIASYHPIALAKHTNVLHGDDGTTLASITVIYDNVRHYCRELARTILYFGEL